MGLPGQPLEQPRTFSSYFWDTTLAYILRLDPVCGGIMHENGGERGIRTLGEAFDPTLA